MPELNNVSVNDVEMMYRVIDAPHEDTQHRITGPEHLHLLMDKVFLLALGAAQFRWWGVRDGARFWGRHLLFNTDAVLQTKYSRRKDPDAM